MTSGDDRWRHQQSAAPHAPSHDPLTAGLPIGHEPSSSEATPYDAPSVEGGAGAANPLGAILGTAIVVILFAGPIFGTMYPLTGLSAFVAWLVTNDVLKVVAPQLGAYGRLPFALLAGVIALWIVSRCDHRLADTIPAYRFWRHIARLVLIGVFVAVTSLHEFDHGFWPQSLGEVGVLLADARFWIGLGVTATIAHLLLKRANGLRTRWHMFLELVRLRVNYDGWPVTR